VLPLRSDTPQRRDCGRAACVNEIECHLAATPKAKLGILLGDRVLGDRGLTDRVMNVL
jgi:hypothetical protein